MNEQFLCHTGMPVGSPKQMKAGCAPWGNTVRQQSGTKLRCDNGSKGGDRRRLKMRSDRASNINLICSLIVMAASAILALANSAFAQETAKGLLAVQVRSQGHVCDNPISARRDKKQPAPDVSVWVLKCERNAYRVRLAPDMAARIQRIR
jgi:hypothetical protein